MIERVIEVDPLVDGVLRVLHVVHGSGVVEARRIAAAAHRREIDQTVRPVAADDAHRNASAHVSLYARPVVAAVQIDPDLFRLIRVEAAREIRRGPPRPGCDLYAPL